MTTDEQAELEAVERVRAIISDWKNDGYVPVLVDDLALLLARATRPHD